MNTLAQYIAAMHENSQNELRETVKGMYPALLAARKSELQKANVMSQIEQTNAYNKSIGSDIQVNYNPETEQPTIDPNLAMNMARDEVELKAGIESATANYGAYFDPKDIKTTANLKARELAANKNMTRELARTVIHQNGLSEVDYRGKKLGEYIDTGDFAVADYEFIKQQSELKGEEGTIKEKLASTGYWNGTNYGELALSDYNKEIKGKELTLSEKKVIANQIMEKYQGDKTKAQFLWEKARTKSGEKDKTIWNALEEKGITAIPLSFTIDGQEPTTLKTRYKNGTWQVYVRRGGKDQWLTKEFAESRGIRLTGFPEKNSDDLPPMTAEQLKNLGIGNKDKSKPTENKDKAKPIEQNDFVIVNGKKVFR